MTVNVNDVARRAVSRAAQSEDATGLPRWARITDEEADVLFSAGLGALVDERPGVGLCVQWERLLGRAQEVTE